MREKIEFVECIIMPEATFAKGKTRYTILFVWEWGETGATHKKGLFGVNNIYARREIPLRKAIFRSLHSFSRFYLYLYSLSLSSASFYRLI